MTHIAPAVLLQEDEETIVTLADIINKRAEATIRAAKGR